MVVMATVFLMTSGLVQAQSLKGSRASMERQNREAINYGLTFIEASSAIATLVERGQLVKVVPDRDLALNDVSYPYALTSVKLLLDRLSAHYLTTR